jgi:UDP-3-O-[3-hydroxymyristoyl] glucosamine N-acyltransferase
VTIGDFVTVYPNATISGSVLIGRCVDIGTGVNIIQNKSVGDNSIIGAGAVTINLFNNSEDAIMRAWKREKRQRTPRRFFLSGCMG